MNLKSIKSLKVSTHKIDSSDLTVEVNPQFLSKVVKVCRISSCVNS